MSIEMFDENSEKLYRLLREIPKENLPGLDNCPEYQELYDSAQKNAPEDYIWFTETMDWAAYILSGAENGRGRFASLSDTNDMPKLIMEEILTGNRSEKI